MISILPKNASTAQLHGYLLGAVGPRPIAFASTLDKEGNPNLAPFSFFNVFSADPPILIFSPARRVRDNTTKHTLENVLETREVVINVVSFDMVQQMSLASTEYPKGENEFKKSGLTMRPSDEVAPHRVAESPVQFECKVAKVEALGTNGGAGNLVFCEILKLHIATSILDVKGTIDPYKIDQVARMGGNWYSRANKGIFQVPKPLSQLGIGVDRIPENIRLSKVLTGNDLGKLGNVAHIPTGKEVEDFLGIHESIRNMRDLGDKERLHEKAKEYLEKNDTDAAWKTLLAL
ncbi:MAG: flavin reductase family protein [Bacteroidota bacterium]